MSGILLLLVAGVLLLAGAELFAENAARAGGRLGVTALAVGLLLAGAEPEELITALLAAVEGRTAISVGDALGANVTMLTAVVGAAALLRGVPVGAVAALTTLDATRYPSGGRLAACLLRGARRSGVETGAGITSGRRACRAGGVDRRPPRAPRGAPWAAAGARWDRGHGRGRLRGR